jgi:hypothetical protein
LDFALIKGFSDIYTKIEGNLDLISDHSAIILTMSTNAILQDSVPKLCTKNTDWSKFGELTHNMFSWSIVAAKGGETEPQEDITSKDLEKEQ